MLARVVWRDVTLILLAVVAVDSVVLAGGAGVMMSVSVGPWCGPGRRKSVGTIGARAICSESVGYSGFEDGGRWAL